MRKIMLYEDNDLMRGLLVEWLREAGYQISSGPRPDGHVDLVIASLSSPKPLVSPATSQSSAKPA